MMKRIAALLFALLLLSAAGCRKPQPQPDPAPDPAPTPAQPLALSELTLELTRTGREAEDLTALRRELPALLIQALAAQNCTVQTVTVTFGPSEGATAQALADGSVLAACLPCSLLPAPQQAVLALGSAPSLTRDGSEPSDWQGAPPASGAGGAGQRTLLCSTRTEYGSALAKKSSLRWTDLQGAVWAIPEEVSPMASLWLSDRFDGRTLADLPYVTVCEDYETLLRAGAEGKADILVFPADLREDYAAAWTTDFTRTDALGRSGFGRVRSIWQELPVLGVTAPLYGEVLAVSGVNADAPALAEALGAAFQDLMQTPKGAALLERYGCTALAPVTAEGIAAYERLALLEG